MGQSSSPRQPGCLSPFGIVDLVPAPFASAVGDSVAHILEEMGLECCGTHGVLLLPFHF